MKRYYSDEKLFLKTPQDVESLFNNLQYCIDNSEDLRIKRDHVSIFEIFENGWMDDQGEIQILKIIKEGLTINDPSKFKGIWWESKKKKKKELSECKKPDLI